VCHGDLGPWNTVYPDGLPIAFIDWDAAGPREPLVDIAAAAYAFVPLEPDRQLREAGFDPPPDPGARLRLFVDAYGLPERQRSCLRCAKRSSRPPRTSAEHRWTRPRPQTIYSSSRANYAGSTPYSRRPNAR
jgi:aminoglycoside phosphotransferase (APT) family kinase protein